ncbi:MAG: hypothetical protein R3Y56_02225 [Akkermansia sp.]
MKIKPNELKMLHIWVKKAHVASASPLTIEEFRHDGVKTACGRDGLSSIAPCDIPAVRDHFKRLAGAEIVISAREQSARCIAIDNLRSTLLNYGLSVGYLAHYMADRFQRDFSGCTTLDQLLTSFYACVIRQLDWTMQARGKRLKRG